MKRIIYYQSIPGKFAKAILMAIILVHFSIISTGQDMLFLKSGQEQKVIVRKVGVDKVEYIRYDNQGGPTYELNKSDILKIIYQNGIFDFFDNNAREVDDSVKNEQIFYDERDSMYYKYVVIGNQTWLTENLTFKVDQSPCYEGQPGYCDFCGRYYNFEEALIACPKGWHLPTDEDWMELEIEAGMLEVEAAKSGWRGTSPGQAPALMRNGKCNLNLMMCGFIKQTSLHDRNNKFIPYDIDAGGYYWTSTEIDQVSSFIRHLKGRRSIQRIPADNLYRLPIRCIKD